MRTIMEFATRSPAVLPPIGNGELSLQIDPEGAMSPEFGLKSICPVSNWQGMVPGIRRAGWRWGGDHRAGRELFPFGFFTQELPGRGEPSRRRLTFDTDLAEVVSEISWADGTVLTTEIFCHATENLVAIRKRASAPVPFCFHHHPEHRRLTMKPRKPGLWDCIYDLDEIREEPFALFACGPGFTPEENGLLWRGTLTGCVWILAWGEAAIRKAGNLSFEELRREHRAVWAAFYKRSTPPLLPTRMKRSYDMALYHLKISTTRWSVPTGLFDSHWHGRFFAFDELFILRGLLRGGAQNSGLPHRHLRTGEAAGVQGCAGRRQLLLSARDSGRRK